VPGLISGFGKESIHLISLIFMIMSEQMKPVAGFGANLRNCSDIPQIPDSRTPPVRVF